MIKNTLLWKNTFFEGVDEGKIDMRPEVRPFRHFI